VNVTIDAKYDQKPRASERTPLMSNAILSLSKPVSYINGVPALSLYFFRSSI